MRWGVLFGDMTKGVAAAAAGCVVAAEATGVHVEDSKPSIDPRQDAGPRATHAPAGSSRDSGVFLGRLRQC